MTTPKRCSILPALIFTCFFFNNFNYFILFLGHFVLIYIYSSDLLIQTCKRMASSQTSSFLEQTSDPFMIVLRAACMRPVTSSNRAAAIQPTIGKTFTEL